MLAQQPAPGFQTSQTTSLSPSAEGSANHPTSPLANNTRSTHTTAGGNNNASNTNSSNTLPPPLLTTSSSGNNTNTPTSTSTLSSSSPLSSSLSLQSPQVKSVRACMVCYDKAHALQMVNQDLLEREKEIENENENEQGKSTEGLGNTPSGTLASAGGDISSTTSRTGSLTTSSTISGDRNTLTNSDAEDEGDDMEGTSVSTTTKSSPPDPVSHASDASDSNKSKNISTNINNAKSSIDPSSSSSGNGNNNNGSTQRGGRIRVSEHPLLSPSFTSPQSTRVWAASSVDRDRRDSLEVDRSRGRYILKRGKGGLKEGDDQEVVWVSEGIDSWGRAGTERGIDGSEKVESRKDTTPSNPTPIAPVQMKDVKVLPDNSSSNTSSSTSSSNTHESRVVGQGSENRLLMGGGYFILVDNHFGPERGHHAIHNTSIDQHQDREEAKEGRKGQPFASPPASASGLAHSHPPLISTPSTKVSSPPLRALVSPTLGDSTASLDNLDSTKPVFLSGSNYTTSSDIEDTSDEDGDNGSTTTSYTSANSDHPGKRKPQGDNNISTKPSSHEKLSGHSSSNNNSDRSGVNSSTSTKSNTSRDGAGSINNSITSNGAATIKTRPTSKSIGHSYEKIPPMNTSHDNMYYYDSSKGKENKNNRTSSMATSSHSNTSGNGFSATHSKDTDSLSYHYRSRFLRECSLCETDVPLRIITNVIIAHSIVNTKTIEGIEGGLTRQIEIETNQKHLRYMQYFNSLQPLLRPRTTTSPSATSTQNRPTEQKGSHSDNNKNTNNNNNNNSSSSNNNNNPHNTNTNDDSTIINNNNNNTTNKNLSDTTNKNDTQSQYPPTSSNTLTSPRVTLSQPTLRSPSPPSPPSLIPYDYLRASKHFSDLLRFREPVKREGSEIQVHHSSNYNYDRFSRLLGGKGSSGTSTSSSGNSATSSSNGNSGLVSGGGSVAVSVTSSLSTTTSSSAIPSMSPPTSLSVAVGLDISDLLSTCFRVGAIVLSPYQAVFLPHKDAEERALTGLSLLNGYLQLADSADDHVKSALQTIRDLLRDHVGLHKASSIPSTSPYTHTADGYNESLRQHAPSTSSLMESCLSTADVSVCSETTSSLLSLTSPLLSLLHAAASFYCNQYRAISIPLLSISKVDSSLVEPRSTPLLELSCRDFRTIRFLFEDLVERNGYVETYLVL